MRKSKLSWYKQTRLIELFMAGCTGRTTANLVGVNKNTASLYFHRLRLLIYQNDENAGLFEGEIEVDESDFGGRRKGKRGRGAVGKVPVAKPMVATVIALEDWTRAVIEKPVINPRPGVLVQLFSMDRNASPAASFNPSVINHMPTKNKPRPPSSALTYSILKTSFIE